MGENAKLDPAWLSDLAAAEESGFVHATASPKRIVAESQTPSTPATADCNSSHGYSWTANRSNPIRRSIPALQVPVGLARRTGGLGHREPTMPYGCGSGRLCGQCDSDSATGAEPGGPAPSAITVCSPDR